MRLLLDGNLSSRRIGGPLREHGHDVRGVADELDLQGLDDESVLEVATRDGRILITRNSRDFAPVCRLWAEAGREHAGVMLIWSLSHHQYGQIIRGVERWLEQMPEAAAWPGTVVSL